MTAPPAQPDRRESRLSAAVGGGKPSRAEDVLWLRSALGTLGRHGAAGRDVPVVDRDLDAAIRAYQRDRGLKRDGWLGPNGETECSLCFDLASLEDC
jgi:hypothetical protein